MKVEIQDSKYNLGDIVRAEIPDWESDFATKIIEGKIVAVEFSIGLALFGLKHVYRRLYKIQHGSSSNWSQVNDNEIIKVLS